jgi:hypothetical protein
MRTIAGRYHPLRYEDMVRAPERVMAAVCAHLGIAMDDRLLIPTHTGEPARHNSSDMAAAGRPGEIVLSPVGRFAESLSAEEVSAIERLLGPQMEACGYPLLRSSLGESGSTFSGLDWRTSLLAWKTARSRAAHRGSRIPFIGA